ncbi:cytochrome P450 [Thozetella sp. PMI_491]|nr:cytochrome P450 [Thozetella sp. PMI_491]
MALSPVLLLTAASACLAALYWLSQIGRRPANYPPGPPTVPVLGNIHLMPEADIHGQFRRWSREYGAIYSLMLGTKTTIVLSGQHTVKDLLDKRSAYYSSRPEMYLARLLSGDARMVLMEYGDMWRTTRKIVHNSLNINAARTYVAYQDLENKRLLLDFVERPELFKAHIRRYTSSLTTQIVFGFRTPYHDEPKLMQLIEGFEEFCRISVSPIAQALDCFPLLRYLPDAVIPMRKHARKLHKEELKLYMEHYDNIREKVKKGAAKPCFCVDLIQAQEEEGFSDAIACYTSGTLLEAGSDTTASTLTGFVRAMLCFPEVARTAQEELDRVCGKRLPELDDLPNLPYIRGCMKESLRTMPPVILGIPHAIIRDDEYLGYKIPKGAQVMCNVWALNNDPERYPNPEVFDPTRWALDEQTSAEAANNSDVAKRDHFSFGAGRRVCPGMHIADRSLFLAISRLLWAFEFRRPLDKATGREVVPGFNDNTDGLASWPKDFDADIVPRDQAKVARIREAWAKMSELLDDELQWNILPEGVQARG